MQIKQMISRMEKLRSELGGKSTDVEFILCGDFNSPPDGDVYKYMVEEKAYRNALNAKFNNFENTQLAEAIANEPEFTTIKVLLNCYKRKKIKSIINTSFISIISQVRDDKLKIQTIDYIWFSSPTNIKVRSIYEIPSQSQVGSKGFPSGEYPSDHIAIAVKVTI